MFYRVPCPRRSVTISPGTKQRLLTMLERLFAVLSSLEDRRPHVITFRRPRTAGGLSPDRTSWEPSKPLRRWPPAPTTWIAAHPRPVRTPVFDGGVQRRGMGQARQWPRALGWVMRCSALHADTPLETTGACRGRARAASGLGHHTVPPHAPARAIYHVGWLVGPASPLIDTISI